MERQVIIQGLVRTEDGLEFDHELSFEPEEYVGLIPDDDDYYLVTRKGDDILLKPCVADITVDVTRDGIVTNAEFYFNRQENAAWKDAGRGAELYAQITANGKPDADLGISQQNGFFHAYYVDQSTYLEIKEWKCAHPTRTVRDASEISYLESRVSSLEDKLREKNK